MDQKRLFLAIAVSLAILLTLNSEVRVMVQEGPKDHFTIGGVLVSVENVLVPVLVEDLVRNERFQWVQQVQRQESTVIGFRFDDSFVVPETWVLMLKFRIDRREVDWADRRESVGGSIADC